jgi:hypothetical protein
MHPLPLAAAFFALPSRHQEQHLMAAQLPLQPSRQTSALNLSVVAHGIENQPDAVSGVISAYFLHLQYLLFSMILFTGAHMWVPPCVDGIQRIYDVWWMGSNGYMMVDGIRVQKVVTASQSKSNSMYGSRSLRTRTVHWLHLEPTRLLIHCLHCLH